MGKRTGIVLLLISVAAAVYFICFLGKPTRLSEMSIDDKQLQEIISNRNLSDENMIDRLLFDEQKLLFDEEANTFYYSLVEGSSSAYNPYVKKYSTCKDISLAVLNAQITPADVKADKTYQLIAYNVSSYRIYNLKCTTLPLMNIECGGEIGDDDAAMHMTLFDNRKGAAQRFTESDGDIHIRGGSTRTYPKKGYKLSLTKTSLADHVRLNKVSLLGMRQDDDWILYAAYNDQEKIRNVFSSKLWKDTCAQDNSLGIDNGMEYQYIELFLNNQYWGLYALGYPIDELQLGIDMTRNEHLYKKISWDSETQILSQPEVAVVGYDTKESEDDEWAPLKKYYAALSAEWKNSEAMYSGIDLDNAIDMYLFINLIQGLDHAGGLNSLSIKNMFLSVHNKEGKDIMLYTPWDMDVTWGNQWTGDAETNLIKPYGISSSQNIVMGLGNLPALILNGDDDIWDLILTKYKTLRDTLWSEEAVNKILDEYEEDIYLSGAYLRDMSRWPDGSYWDADKGLENFRTYVSGRLHELDDYYSRVEEAVSGSEPCKNAYIIRSLQYKDFLQSDFMLLLNDRTLLSNSDYQEFLEYIGIDGKLITDNVNLVVVNGAGKKAEYYDAGSMAEGIDTCIGTVCTADNDSGVICRDHQAWCTSDINGHNRIDLIFGSGEEVLHFDFSKEYVMWSNLCELQDPGSWCEELKNQQYHVVIEIVNHDIIKEERFRALLSGFGVETDNIRESTDFIVVQNTAGAVTILDNSHESGTRAETVLGTLSVFYNDEGGYGVYLNNEECMAAWPADNQNVDIRVAVVSDNPYEVIWCPTFSYE
ncbi:MAG: CotH kinase family protein [Lachnospiraceae bacterium]|nr:CotH kinase family protein [Lachnospiraceae bacterium]